MSDFICGRGEKFWGLEKEALELGGVSLWVCGETQVKLRSWEEEVLGDCENERVCAGGQGGST